MNMSHHDTSVPFIIEHPTHELPVCVAWYIEGVSRICLSVVAPNNTAIQAMRHEHDIVDDGF